jgi:hypothetical protein
MAQIDRMLVSVAFVWLMLGMVLGLHMGITANNQLLSVHITMLLPGFVVLAVYGTVYRLWPALKESGLAKAQAWMAIFAALGQVLGAYHFAASGGTETMLIAASSGLAIFASVLMFWLFWTKTADAKAHGTHAHHAY